MPSPILVTTSSPTADDRRAGLELKRDLGLYAVLTISLGAMMGSGIFVLPGLAVDKAGPAAALAYLLAGFVVLPAAISQSEMATAMPQAGGSYLFIDRAMGPLMGTIAGFGVWFSLVFKSGFALVGLGAYLQLAFDNVSMRAVALILGAVLVALNAWGVRRTGGLQAYLVTTVLIVLGLFVLVGFPSVDRDHFEPFFRGGTGGLLSVTGLVFVAYAGVTNVASVAEEVKRPGRNIPRGMLTSVVLMMVMYPLLILVITGVTPRTDLVGDITPMATAASIFAGTAGKTIVGFVAVLALISMANAGLLSSSRYPFAMARNQLAPAPLGKINARSATPVLSVILTGAVLLILIAVFPIIELAKLASAFQLLVFSLVNLAHIAFRESRLDWYRPSFRAPLYPWLQIFGILASIVVLSQMGTVPIVGAVVISLAGIGWYRLFGRSRTSHESASLDALRVRGTERLVVETKKALDGPGKRQIAIVVNTGVSDRRAHDLIRTAVSVKAHDASVSVIRVEREGPDGDVRTSNSPRELKFEERIRVQATDLGIGIEVLHATGRHHRTALAEHAAARGVDLSLAELFGVRHGRGFAADLEWLGDHLVCDFAFLGNRYLEDINDIAVLGSGGPVDATKVNLAGRIAAAEIAGIRFVHVLGDHASGRQVVALRAYHAQLDDVVDAPTQSEVFRSTDLMAALIDKARTADLVIMGAVRSRFRVVTDFVDRIRARVDSPLLLVRTHELATRPSLAGRVVERLLQ